MLSELVSGTLDLSWERGGRQPGRSQHWRSCASVVSRKHSQALPAPQPQCLANRCVVPALLTY